MAQLSSVGITKAMPDLGAFGPIKPAMNGAATATNATAMTA